jgi:glycosyltransferase involved in cell wall biosynthesis
MVARYEPCRWRERNDRGWGLPTQPTPERPVPPGATVEDFATDRVAILLCAKDGAAFLGEQLRSFADQQHRNWSLIVSDDGSRDGTRDVIERFATDHPQRVVIRNGPERGVCANFLSLANDRTIDADYFAFSDQDDIWHADKLARALAWLAEAPDGTPALYCGRTELMTVDGQSYGLSPLFRRPPAFRNALVQNLAGGNTMVFNRAAKKLLEAAGAHEVVLHDWWLYQLASAAGGTIRYDPRPSLKYRQHRDNLVGSNHGWRPRLARVRMMLGGRFRDWNATNIAALCRLPPHLITPENRKTLELFAAARTASLAKRLVYLRQSGVYRQTLLGNLGLLAAAVMKRI